VGDPRLQAFPTLTQKVVEKHAAGFDVYVSCSGVKPRCVSPGAEHLGEAAVELQHKIQVYGLEPNSSIVALAIKRSISELYSYHVRKFGSWFRKKAIGAPEWSVNSSKPI
jgi:hypothetical protein